MTLPAAVSGGLIACGVYAAIRARTRVLVAKLP
jgi:hypothetical protein